MIIVEGVDGSGKSSLVKRINEELKIPIHPRASDSIDGPVKDLWDWADRDVNIVQPFAVYDRHPLVSEYIYGPVTRGTMDERFFGWEAKNLLARFRTRSLVIFCDPGLARVVENAKQAPQMSGVWENIASLYWLYRYTALNWHGRGIYWDYWTGEWDVLRTIIDHQRKIYESVYLNV